MQELIQGERSLEAKMRVGGLAYEIKLMQKTQSRILVLQVAVEEGRQRSNQSVVADIVHGQSVVNETISMGRFSGQLWGA